MDASPQHTPLKVCHFLETLPGGPATYLNELIPLQEKFYGAENITIVAPVHQLSHLKGIRAQMLPVTYSRRTALDLWKLRKQWKQIIERNHFDVIHLHSTFSGLVGRSVNYKLKEKIVYCSHGWAFTMNVREVKKRIYALIERILASRTDEIIVISKSELDAAIERRIPANKCHLIANGIALSPITKVEDISRDDVIIRLLFVGRLDRQKGYDILIDAMRYLDRTRYSLDVVGGAVVDKKAPRFIAEPGFVMHGWKQPEEVKLLMANCDVVVMPSRWEAFGLVAAEAMREGKAVVASNVGGLSELIKHNETGVLFDVGNGAMLAAAIEHCSKHATEFGRKGRERFERYYTSEKMFQAINDVYREVRQR